MKTPQCVVDRWTRRGSLTRRLKGSFAVSWPKQLGNTTKLQKLIYRPLMGTRGWFQRSYSSSFEFLLAEGNSEEISGRNFLQGTFCFQFSTVFQFYCYIPLKKEESSRAHFEVLGLKNCPVLGSRTALFFKLSKFCRLPEKFFCRSSCLRIP